MKVYFILSLMFFFNGCTNADRAYINAYGKPGVIVCYSGGKIIFEGKSTGIIQTVTSSDGWEFQDSLTGLFVRVSGDCVIRN